MKDKIDIGREYFSTFKNKQYRPHQKEAIEFILNSTKKVIMIQAPTGCHPKGQGILLYDGTIKKVEDIIKGDILVDDNGNPTKVLHLERGYSYIYEVVSFNGSKFYINEYHTLTLIYSIYNNIGNQENYIIDIDLKDYFAIPEEIQQNLYLFKCDFYKVKNKKIPLNKYIKSKFTIDYYNEDDYYGFTLDGNGRYLLDDFTVTHNSGKSLIGAVSGALSGSMVYLVQTISLQDQIKQDFPEFELLMGRANYPCKYDLNNNCSDCSGKKCPDCNYKLQKQIVLNHPLRIVNYSYYLTEANYIGGFSGIPFLICDEADTLEQTLSDFISLQISEKVLNYLKIGLPKFKTATINTVPVWKEWAEKTISTVTTKIGKLENEISTYDNFLKEDQRRTIKTKDRLNTLYSKLQMFIRFVDTSWLMKEESLQRQSFAGTKQYTRWTFEPLWITREMTDEFFLRHTQKIVLMSATFPPIKVLSQKLGFDKKEIDFLELPLMFPVENRKVIIDSAGNLCYNTFNDEVSNVAQKIYDIMKLHPDEKGLIHCTSYKLTNYLLQWLQGTDFSNRVITHNSVDRNSVLESFKQSSKPLVLLSPSMERGVDLKGDYGRFNIVAKAPFLNLGDVKVKKRLYSGGAGKFWYKNEAIQSIIQMCGRCVRSEDDYCINYIVEEGAKNLLMDNLQLLPKYFRESII